MTLPFMPIAVRPWQEVEEEVGKIPYLDPGIFEAVVALNVLAISTLSSCEGHLNSRLSAPFVIIGVSDRLTTERDFEVRNKITHARNLFSQGQEQEAQRILSETEQTWDMLLSSHFHACQPLQFALTLFYQRASHHTDYDAQLTLLPSRWSFTGVGLLEPRGAIHQKQRPEQEREQCLYRYQQEMHNFTAFLKTFIEDAP
ncbi:MAG TPA: hypothetical protein VKR06_44355 [Ktedonosporobacter sp.]|nr:hypothetical protein [Ktedonosporobacter sp.]